MDDLDYEEGVANLYNECSEDASLLTMAVTASLDPSSDFEGASLQGIEIQNEDLSAFSFRYSDLQGAKLLDVVLTYGALDGANLKHAKLEGIQWVGEPYRPAELLGKKDSWFRLGQHDLDHLHALGCFRGASFNKLSELECLRRSLPFYDSVDLYYFRSVAGAAETGRHFLLDFDLGDYLDNFLNKRNFLEFNKRSRLDIIDKTFLEAYQKLSSYLCFLVYINKRIHPNSRFIEKFVGDGHWVITAFADMASLAGSNFDDIDNNSLESNIAYAYLYADRLGEFGVNLDIDYTQSKHGFSISPSGNISRYRYL